MRVERWFIGSTVLVLLIAACGSSDDSGGNGDGDPDASSGSGGASATGGRSGTGGGSDTGGSSATGGSSSTGGRGSGGAATGGSSATDGGSTGGSGTDDGGPTGDACEELEECCPTAGIFQMACENVVSMNMAAQCAVTQDLFCGGTDGGVFPGGDAGNACETLGSCCDTLSGQDRAQCEQVIDAGLDFACGLVQSALCP